MTAVARAVQVPFTPAYSCHAMSCCAGQEPADQEAVRHPELELNMPPSLFCMSLHELVS